MRVISQDGTIDVPYENVMITLGCNGNKTKYHINGYVIYQEDGSYVEMASYSTEEKAKRAMEMLLVHHEKINFLKTIINTERGQAFVDRLSEDDLDELTQNYFLFPKDDEVE